MASRKRDYKKEYREYHSKPVQRKRRAQRNKARRIMGLKKGDPREVDHKRPLSRGGVEREAQPARGVPQGQPQQGQPLPVGPDIQ